VNLNNEYRATECDIKERTESTYTSVEDIRLKLHGFDQTKVGCEGDGRYIRFIQAPGINTHQCTAEVSLVVVRGGSKGGEGAWDDLPPETYEGNFIHHAFVQFGKQHLRCKVIVPSIVLSQQCCEVCFISLETVAKP